MAPYARQVRWYGAQAKEQWQQPEILIHSPGNVRKGNRTPKEADMPLSSVPRRPVSTLYFEATRQIRSGRRSEWRKYVIGA